MLGIYLIFSKISRYSKLDCVQFLDEYSRERQSPAEVNFFGKGFYRHFSRNSFSWGSLSKENEFNNCTK